MLPPPHASLRVFRELYPAAEPNDPESIEEYGSYFLVPELRVELDLFYGSLDKNDPHQRKCRRPGIDYNDKGWRNRMAKWYYHAELFQIFEKLHLNSREIHEVCTWWGSKAEVDEWELSHPGMVIGDDIWDGIPVATRRGPPEAIFHHPPETRPPAPRKRTSRLRRMMPRPRAIRGWRELKHEDLAHSQLDGLREEDSPMSSSEPSSPDDDSILDRSVGVPLNQSLRTGGQSPAFEEWYKDELENGHLPSASTGMPMSMSATTPHVRPRTYAHVAGSYHPATPSHPFQVSTNTISYRATPYSSHTAMTMPSYTQRMMNAAAAQRPSLHQMPVAITDSTPRSSQARQSTLGRYHQMPRQYQYRPIRPRPMRQPSSRG